MNKIKVLFTIPNFDTAGSGKVVYDLAIGLNSNFFEVHIACHHTKGVFFKEVEALGFPIHIINTTIPLKPYHNFFLRLQPFKRFIKENHFDLVHSWHWSSDWSEVLAVRIAGAKYVYTKKAMTWGNMHWKIKSYLSSFIITLNPEMRTYFSYKKAQKLIPLGIDMDVYRPMQNVENESEAFTIITVANLVPVKGIEVLMDAIKLVNVPDIQLEVIGDDTTVYGNQLKKKVKEDNLEKQVVFRGKQKDVRPFLAKADLYVIPSFKEGMPMALVEAMAMALPVLGSDIPGIRYVLKDFNHLLFESGNSEKLANKILQMYQLSKQDRFNLGVTLRKSCQEYFSKEFFIQEHENLYLKMLNR